MSLEVAAGAESINWLVALIDDTFDVREVYLMRHASTPARSL